MSPNPSSAGDSNIITISINRPDGSLYTFDIKKSNRFRKMMQTYAVAFGLDISLVRFSFEGRRLQPHNIPNEVQMGEGDRINMLLDIGGTLYRITYYM